MSVVGHEVYCVVIMMDQLPSLVHRSKGAVFKTIFFIVSEQQLIKMDKIKDTN